MSIDLITEHFDIWTSAVTYNDGQTRKNNGEPELTGVDKLRELILELAVRGKLVPQDPDDEPASKLLERIEEEKKRLYREGKIKKPKHARQILEDEKPFHVPEVWTWTRLANMASYVQRGKSPKYADASTVKVVSQKCVQWRRFAAEQARWVADDALVNYQSERFLRKGDLLWNSTGTGTVGRIVSLKETPSPTMVADSHVTVVRLVEVSEAFIAIFLKSPFVYARIDPLHPDPLVSGTTKQVELNAAEVRELPVPVPPCKEQYRIVEKVDELMALCDRLEQQTRDQIEAHETLVGTLLDALTCSEDVDELAANWDRIADNFDTLFTTEVSIDRLQETILQLAVRGRLVRQDPHDEPASKLLERIEEEKERLYREGTIKKPRKSTPIGQNEQHFSTPDSWVWLRVCDVGFTQTGSTPPKDEPHFYGSFLPFVKPGDIQGWDIEGGEDGLSEEGVIALRRRADPGSLMMVCIGSLGKCGHLLVSSSFNQQINALTPYLKRSSRFLLYAFASRYFQDEVWAKSSSTTITILNKRKWENITIPFPPLEEQQRIVEKVDELIGLCDWLRCHVRQAEDTRHQLADVIVETEVE